MRHLKMEVVSLVFTPVNKHSEVYARPYVFGLPTHALNAVSEVYGSDQLENYEGREHVLIASEVADFVTVSPQHIGQPVGLPDGMQAPRCSFILTLRSSAVTLNGQVVSSLIHEYQGFTSALTELTFEEFKKAYLHIDNYRIYTPEGWMRGAGNFIHDGSPSQGMETISRACDIFAKMDVHDFVQMGNVTDTRTMLIPQHRFATNALSWVPSRMAHDLGFTIMDGARSLGLFHDNEDGENQPASEELENMLAEGQTPGEVAEGKDHETAEQYTIGDLYGHCRSQVSEGMVRLYGVSRSSSHPCVITIDNIVEDWKITEAELMNVCKVNLAPKIDQSYTSTWERTSMHSYLAWLISNVTFGYAQHLGLNKLWYTMQKDTDGGQETIVVQYEDAVGKCDTVKEFEEAINEELYPVIEKLFKEDEVEVQVSYDREDLVVRINDVMFTRPNWMSSMYAPVLSTLELDKRNHPAIEAFLNGLVDPSHLQEQ